MIVLFNACFFCAACQHEKLFLHLWHIQMSIQIWQNLKRLAGSDARRNKIYNCIITIIYWQVVLAFHVQ